MLFKLSLFISSFLVYMSYAEANNDIKITNFLLSEFKREWEDFKEIYEKVYENEQEDAYRMEIFVDNLKFVTEHNKLYENGIVNYLVEMNWFGDKTDEEIKLYQGYVDEPENAKASGDPIFLTPANVLFPKYVDWRNASAVSEVKDQFECGSSWAFSATGALEGQHFRKTGVLVELSEQNLIDCSKSFGNLGCSGGNAKKAFRYIQHNGGIDSDLSYPYKGDEQNCRFQKHYVGASAKGFVKIPKNEESLRAAVATVGPIAVAIDASNKGFRFYSGGVYHDDNCSETKLNHGVLVVGYGKSRYHGDYWIVKNSWGEDYGDEGYIKMARNHNNLCGIANSALYPLV